MGLLIRPAGWTSWTDQLDGSAGQTSWTDQLDRPAGLISWMDQFVLFEALASSLIRRFPFSLYIVAASESDEGLVSKIGPNGQCSKIVNFNRTEAGLTSKWGKISPAV